jgi:ankyrin repeat protein
LEFSLSLTECGVWKSGWFILFVVSATLSTTEAKHLLRLCKSGRLFEVQSWIASGNSLSVPADLRTTPLKVALDTGFHSLVELLVRNEPSQDLKNQALRHAISHKRLAFIELLVSHGAEISSVPFIEVLQVWDPTIIRYFLNHGADVIKDSPFAVAFGERIQTAIGPWRECKEKYPDAAPHLQEQADRALRHFCFKGDLKWVSLLMWAGADPRSVGPTLDDDGDLDESEHSTALTAAAYCENLEILKRLKPDAKRDDIDALVKYAAPYPHADVVRYLLKLGAKPNDKPNGGSAALDGCLESFHYETFRYRFSFASYGSPSKAGKYSLSNMRAMVQLLLDEGAFWRPDDADHMSRVRRSLYECEPDVMLELVERLVKHTACAQDTIRDLLRTPTMKKHLVSVATKLSWMGFEIRTTAHKAEDERQKELSRQGALRYLASRYDREEIYEAIWLEPIQHVARRYKLSDVGLAKVCKRLNIPRPGRGYWAKKAAGRPIPKRPPLPELSI